MAYGVVPPTWRPSCLGAPNQVRASLSWTCADSLPAAGNRLVIRGPRRDNSVACSGRDDRVSAGGSQIRIVEQSELLCGPIVHHGALVSERVDH